jgi:hypothetical protein
MRWRRRLIRDLLVATLAGLMVIAAWFVFERAVAGPGYRWTSWREIADPTITTFGTGATFGTGRVPNVECARFLDGRKITMIVQRPDSNVLGPALQMPSRHDMLPGAPLILLRMTGSKDGLCRWRVLRVWGTLRILPSPAQFDGFTAPLELQVDEMGEDPRYLPDAIAPSRAMQWIVWCLSSSAAVLGLIALMRAMRWLLQVRLIGRIAAITSALVVCVLTIAVMAWPHSVWLQIHDGTAILAISATPKGFKSHWESDYSRSNLSFYPGYLGPSWTGGDGIRTWCGLGLHTGYMPPVEFIGDCDNVHAQISAIAATPWIIAPFFLFALLAWKLSGKRQFAVGCCQSCGYDLRASPDRCPECGKIPAKP